MRRLRRRYRDAEGVDGVGIGEGCLLPHPTRRSEERRELPQPGPANAFSALFSVTERFRCNTSA